MMGVGGAMPASKVLVLVRRVFGGEQVRDCEQERVVSSVWQVSWWRQRGIVWVQVQAAKRGGWVC